MQVTWPGGHRSSFDSLWLNDHQLKSGQAHLSSEHLQLPQRKLWRADDIVAEMDSLRFSMPRLLQEPELVFEWLSQLCRYGITFVVDAGTEPGALKRLAEHVAIMKRTAYG